ncbi:uncharacterized protein LOC120128543 [Hibiscus syriacus]|uniref:uncharacterized protein LOC120128543 n=1 Tax=Hibiscus syriacus TaxID=106335 RepID=UPI0019230694|nr:uncharacterized protein LOC120128543 [Hibiscus syriacus]
MSHVFPQSPVFFYYPVANSVFPSVQPFGSVPYYQGGHMFSSQVPYPVSMAHMYTVSGDFTGKRMSSSPTAFVSTIPSGNVSTNTANTIWYPDTGATHHITNDLSVFNSGTTYTGHEDS